MLNTYYLSETKWTNSILAVSQRGIPTDQRIPSYVTLPAHLFATTHPKYITPEEAYHYSSILKVRLGSILHPHWRASIKMINQWTNICYPENHTKSKLNAFKFHFKIFSFGPTMLTYVFIHLTCHIDIDIYK